MLTALFLISLILIPGIVLIYHYKEQLEKHNHQILAFAVFTTTGMFILDLLHPNVALYSNAILQSHLSFWGLAVDNILSSFLLVFLIGTCWAIIRIELAPEEISLPEQSKKV